MSTISVLVVADGIFNFAQNDPSDATFTITTFLSILRNSQSPSIFVDTAHRRSDPNAKFQNFNFAASIPDLSGYDEIWLFGFEGTNNNPENPGPPPGNLPFINDDEIAAIARFMNGGGGVLAAGDHEGLGSLMCGKIPRVRSMRKWFSEVDIDPTIPAAAPRNWPGAGPFRADTLQAFYDGTWNFDNQSDDIPQKLTFPSGIAHPILFGPNGPITRFPDHMHEGEVILPWSLTDTLTFNGQTFVEYPVVGGFQEKPSIIATGNVIGGHATPVEGSACEQVNFYNELVPTNPNGFIINVLCVYEGHNAGVGRVVTDSSFHHYLDLNLTGDPCGVGAKQQGFTTAAGAAVLADLDAFYINTVVWLGTPQLSLSINPSTVIVGQNAIGTLGWIGRMPSGGVQIQLQSFLPDRVMVPAEVTIGPASKSASFTITTGPPGGNVTITADETTGVSSANADLTVLSHPEPPGSVTGLSFDPDPIDFGQITIGTVAIAAPVPPGAVIVALSCDQPKFATVPPSVTVPAAQTTASFTVTTVKRRLPRAVTVGVSASAGGVTVEGQFDLVRGGKGHIKEMKEKDPADIPKIGIETSASGTGMADPSLLSVIKTLAERADQQAGQSEEQPGQRPFIRPEERPEVATAAVSPLPPTSKRRSRR